MGQRLNMEIIQNGKTLANAYYHWSGYTTSSLRLTSTIIDNVEKIQHNNPVIRAVRLLETTNALLTGDEIKKVRQLTKEEKFREAMSRDSGLIAVSRGGIKDTRDWEEGRVEVNLDDETINFNVLSKYDKDTYLEGYEISEEQYGKIPIRNLDFNKIPFSVFDRFASDILQLIQDKIYAVRSKNGEVISFIV